MGIAKLPFEPDDKKRLDVIAERMNLEPPMTAQIIIIWANGCLQRQLGKTALSAARAKKRVKGDGMLPIKECWQANVPSSKFEEFKAWAQGLEMPYRVLLKGFLRQFRVQFQTSGFWPVNHYRQLPPEIHTKVPRFQKELLAEEREQKERAQNVRFTIDAEPGTGAAEA